MAFRLLALDIDGTLLNANGEITTRTQQALAAARAAGVTVALVTGRRFASARRLALELELNAPLISHNGALTKNAATLEIIDYHPLPLDIAQRLINLGHEEEADFLICEDPLGLGSIAVEQRSLDRNVRLARYIQYVREYGLELQVVDNLLDHVREDVIQVMFSGQVEPMAALNDQIAAIVGGAAMRQWTTYRSQDMTILDLLNPAASKGHGVAALARSLNIAQAEVMAIGDNFNDVEMLKFAGLGIIMGNAEPGLKELGFTETASNEEDGAAIAIERYLL